MIEKKNKNNLLNFSLFMLIDIAKLPSFLLMFFFTHRSHFILNVSLIKRENIFFYEFNYILDKH
jgi:hypothetical protein